MRRCIRGAQIIDGTGQPGFAGDIGIVADRIAVIGEIPAEALAVQSVDATGLVAAPGFVDIHTHADIALLARPAHLPKVMQGVTTEVFTNCGLGFAPVTESGLEIQRRYIAGLFGDDGRAGNGSKRGAVDWQWRTVAEFLSRFETQGIGANIAYLIPHGSVRVSVMGMEERPADANELRAMEAMVAQGMEEGAWGLSTGIWYAPMRAAAHEELVALTRAAGFFATHQRDYARWDLRRDRREHLYARDAGVPVQIAHLQMNGPGNAGRAGELLERIEQRRASGVDVSCDTYPYTAGSTFIQSLLPAWAIEDGPEAILRRLGEPETRAEDRGIDRSGASPGSEGRAGTDTILSGAQSDRIMGWKGRLYDAAAEARGMTPPEWVCAVLEEDELRACYVHHAAHEEQVQRNPAMARQMVGSDGLHLPGKTHPRLYGTFPRVLGKYVREEKVIPLEQAIHKMTGMPAARLGLKQRGLLQARLRRRHRPLRPGDGLRHSHVRGPAPLRHRPALRLRQRRRRQMAGSTNERVARPGAAEAVALCRQWIY